MSAATYPARVNARLDQPLSRWVRLVKWILVLPHYVVLAFLWLAFMVLSMVAGVGIRPFGYVTSMVVTIGLWLTLAPTIGAIGRDPAKANRQPVSGH